MTLPRHYAAIAVIFRFTPSLLLLPLPPEASDILLLKNIEPLNCVIQFSYSRIVYLPPYACHTHYCRPLIIVTPDAIIRHIACLLAYYR
jgi:hypothetical protein